MNFFRSEDHVDAWITENEGLSREILSIEQACEWIAFFGRNRLSEGYVNPRSSPELGPLMKSLGLSGEFWKPPK